MKFAHMADVHLGGWREPKLREANAQSFITAIDRIIAEKVDFVLIAGDLLDTSLPSIDSLKVCVQKLKQLKDAGIPAYLIPGSHDFSPSGKTMIDVLEHAGLAKNVAKGEIVDGKLKLKFTIDAKTGAKIAGMIGKKGGLEKHYYYDLHKESLEAEQGTKIFLFHSPLAELKPEELAGMEAMPVSLLPRGFDYYAGGHVHIVQHEKLKEYPNLVYPGPVFPNNFAELEKLECGSFVIYDNGVVRHEKIKLHPVVKIKIIADNKTPAEAEKEIQQAIQSQKLENAIVLLSVEGVLKQGKPTDINFNMLFDTCTRQGAYAVRKNTNKLESREFQQVKTATSTSIEELEEQLVNEHAGQLKILPREQEITLVKNLMRVLSAEKDEGERVTDFEKRITREADKVLGF